MAKQRVLVTSFMLKPGGEVDRKLQAAGLETVYNIWHGKRDEDELIGILEGIDGAIVSIDPFTAKVLGTTDRLRVISRTGVGYDSIDVAAATRKWIAVCTTPGTNNLAVAEFAFALLLACSRKLPENLAEVRAGRWTRHQGLDLMGATLGIVGLGSIGKEVARRARAFGMRVLAFDPARDEAFAAEHAVSYTSLEELLRASDFVSLHLFLDASTRHLISAERLGLMKPSAYLINTSRGGVVDQEALAQALAEKRIAGAALDVFETEPLQDDSPLRKLDNVYLAPHVAGQTVGSAKAMGEMAAENVIRVLRGEKAVFAVNPELYRNS